MGSRQASTFPASPAYPVPGRRDHSVEWRLRLDRTGTRPGRVQLRTEIRLYNQILAEDNLTHKSRKVVMKMARSGGNAFLTNFNTYDAPFPSKVRLALANSWKKVRTRSSCCGNHGQPGC